MSSIIQNIIIVLGLIVVAGLGYYLFSQNASGTLEFVNQPVSSQAVAESADFLQKLNKLKSISLDGSLFSDPRFQSLVNNTQPVIEVNIGRPNPFLETRN